MTFDAREKSRNSGQPVNCYRFQHSGQIWLYSDADESITLPVGVFDPQVIWSSEVDYSQEDDSGGMTIKLPVDNEVAQLFVPYLPVQPVTLTRYTTHRGDAEIAITFLGTVSGIRLLGAEAELKCSPQSDELKQSVPGIYYQTQCNLALYSPRCGVDKNAFRTLAVVSTISGDTITSGSFSSQANGWFNGGWVERTNGQRRFIINHVTNVLTLQSPFIGLVSGEQVTAFAGCDRLEETCRTKFSNIANHLGFRRIPKRNPFDGSIT